MLKNNNYRFAMFVAVLAIQVSATFALSPADKNWQDLESRGVAALDANEYWIAEPLLKKAVAQAQDFRPTDMRLPKSIAELGRLYTIRGNFTKAAAYLEAELKVKEQLLRNKQYEYIPTMGSLIQFYFNYGMQDKAEPLSQKMLTLIKDRLRTGQKPIMEWAITCDSAGDRFLSANNFILSSELFETSLKIKTSLLSSNHLSLADSYARMGKLFLAQDEPDKAEPYFANALRIAEKSPSPESHEAYGKLDKLAKSLIAEKKPVQPVAFTIVLPR